MAASSRERSEKFRENKKKREGKKEIRNRWVKLKNFEEVKVLLDEIIKEKDGEE